MLGWVNVDTLGNGQDETIRLSPCFRIRAASVEVAVADMEGSCGRPTDGKVHSILIQPVRVSRCSWLMERVPVGKLSNPGYEPAFYRSVAWITG